jgi:hypothetical protein
VAASLCRARRRRVSRGDLLRARRLHRASRGHIFAATGWRRPGAAPRR